MGPPSQHMKLSCLFFKVLVVSPAPPQQLLYRFSYFIILNFIKLGAYLTIKFKHLIMPKGRNRKKKSQIKAWIFSLEDQMKNFPICYMLIIRCSHEKDKRETSNSLSWNESRSISRSPRSE